MNLRKTEKLLTSYPLLYRELRERSFECGDGWFDLVWQVSAEIESAAQLEGIPKTAESWPSVGILKEKVGTLRVQFRTRVSGAIRALVNKAGERSAEICELCGAPAQFDCEHELSRGVKVLCESCRKALRPLPHPHDKTKLPVWMQERDGKLK